MVDIAADPADRSANNMGTTVAAADIRSGSELVATDVGDTSISHATVAAGSSGDSIVPEQPRAAQTASPCASDANHDGTIVTRNQLRRRPGRRLESQRPRHALRTRIRTRDDSADELFEPGALQQFAFKKTDRATDSQSRTCHTAGSGILSRRFKTQIRRSHILASLLKISCRVGQARFERRPTIVNRCIFWWAGASKRRWSHPTSIFQQAVANVATN